MTDFDGWVLLVHAGATWYMTGLIWFVQVVHYPLLSGVASEGFAEYERRHVATTTLVVGPPMLVEAITGLVAALAATAGLEFWQPVLGLVLLALVWLSTALVQVPCHNRLSAGFDAAAHARLVSTNWIRTIAWSARAVLVAAMIR